MTSEKHTLPQQALENGTARDANAVKQKPSPISPGPPPDGGLAAWLQVACSWLIFFDVLGILNTYGQFQTICETDILIDQSFPTSPGSARFSFSCAILPPYLPANLGWWSFASPA